MLKSLKLLDNEILDLIEKDSLADEIDVAELKNAALCTSGTLLTLAIVDVKKAKLAFKDPYTVESRKCSDWRGVLISGKNFQEKIIYCIGGSTVYVQVAITTMFTSTDPVG